MMDYEKKTAIVTGASSGIGAAVARRLHQQGASVLATGRSERALAELAGALGSRVAVCAADLTEEDAPGRVLEAARAAFGDGIDRLVNAAGIIASADLARTSDELWDRMMAVNLRAPFRLLRAAIPALEARRGAIVNVSSVAGLRSFPGILAYSVSKAGIDQLTRCLALELAPRGIRVNAVDPGVVVTELHRRAGMSEADYAAFLARSKETHPLGRAGSPEEIAELVLFLGGGSAGWVTGETIAIDGGRHLTCAR
jgi:NAD(P)-dependent dehydrogenase (short-subunit alcohol dehydrogenase family)